MIGTMCCGLGCYEENSGIVTAARDYKREIIKHAETIKIPLVVELSYHSRPESLARNVFFIILLIFVPSQGLGTSIQRDIEEQRYIPFSASVSEITSAFQSRSMQAVRYRAGAGQRSHTTSAVRTLHPYRAPLPEKRGGRIPCLP